MVTLPPPPPPASSGGPGWPAHYPARPPAVARGQAIALWIAVSASVIVSIAALVVGIVAVSQPSQMPSAPSTVTAALAAPVLFDDDADRALCESIVDLMRQRNAADQAFMALPPVTSPERNADADPKFKAEVQDWAQRTQKVLAAHREPDRYLTRMLQRYIDDVLLYAQNIEPGKAGQFEDATWNLGVVDYGGARGRCRELGIRWS